MDKDFKQYVYARVEKALTENEEYTRLQSNGVEAIKCKDYDSYCEISEALEAKAQDLCYIQGFKDAIRMLLN